MVELGSTAALKSRELFNTSLEQFASFVDQLDSFVEKLEDESKGLKEPMCFVAPNQLPQYGVDSIFLVVGKSSECVNASMKFWLAKGSRALVVERCGELFVEYINLGELKCGTFKIDKGAQTYGESGSGRINLRSHVILS